MTKMNPELRKKIEKWVAKVGRAEAFKQLVLSGMAGSTADKLVAGNYESEPKRLLLKAIEWAMSDEE